MLELIEAERPEQFKSGEGSARSSKLARQFAWVERTHVRSDSGPRLDARGCQAGTGSSTG